ncbi:VOC family protein [Sphaerimonospora sp. CA-214678]|uniref:VOC family protein n=1 Tax=Sphaerimonospora sp. CA-214678 TaxID=3240029 RepID=UPI003D9297A4
MAAPEGAEFVRRRPAPAPRPLITWYIGYREAGVPPRLHRGLPSPHLTVVITLHDPLVLAAGAYVVTDDPDGIFARATAAGAAVVREPADTDYGSRDFVVRDPEGNHWSFGTYRGEPRG